MRKLGLMTLRALGVRSGRRSPMRRAVSALGLRRLSFGRGHGFLLIPDEPGPHSVETDLFQSRPAGVGTPRSARARPRVAVSTAAFAEPPAIRPAKRREGQ